METVKKKKKTRAGHRAYLTKILPEVNASIANYSEEKKAEVVTWKGTLEEQLGKIAPLDEAILTLLEDDENATEDDMANEIKESIRLALEVRSKLEKINKLLSVPPVPLQSSQQIPPMQSGPPISPPSSQQIQVQNNAPKAKVRLPKLEVRKFDGNLQQWQEFWDSFESAIHANETLGDVDEFSYLRGLGSR